MSAVQWQDATAPEELRFLALVDSLDFSIAHNSMVISQHRNAITGNPPHPAKAGFRKR